MRLGTEALLGGARNGFRVPSGWGRVLSADDANTPPSARRAVGSTAP
jgi:hypothetical protein